MSGYTKYKCKIDELNTLKKLDKLLMSIESILPYEFDFELIKSLLEEYYPHELFLINEQYKYYKIKEENLLLKGKKSRYNFESLDFLIKTAKQYKKINSIAYKNKHKSDYDPQKYCHEIKKIKATRESKIKRIVDKINSSKNKTQEIQPFFLDKLMGLYMQKRSSQKDKVYILKELQKYYCDKILMFFSKINDIEINRQLREMAFYYLQSFGFNPVLRKQKYIRIPSKNKKRRKYLREDYQYQSFDIKGIPQELEYRIENSKDQKLKSYDFFISHSSKDFCYVQKLIKNLNSNGKNVYCDWISDIDYLKRYLLCSSTQKVLDIRMQQSKNVLFVKSENSIASLWCKYELNDFKKQHKNIYCISIDDMKINKFHYTKYFDNWFYDSDYKNIILLDKINDLD